MTRLRRFLALLLPLAIGVISFWLGRTTSRSGEEADRLAQLDQENRELKSAVEQLRSHELDRRAAGGEAPLRGESRPRTPLKQSPHTDQAEAVRAIQESLASANRSIAEWQARTNELQAQLDQAREEQKRLAAVETNLTEQLAAAARRLETREAELARKTDQVALLEAARKLQERAVVAAQQDNQQLKSSAELQELYRRRESYLSSLIGRYREITEQYRAFASVLENRRGPEGTPGAGISIAGPELARIQNSIAMAEEDLRQVNALNAQALRVQKKLSGK
jgi:chromosome segregation ATPase